eukprot:COSAG02_NODE_22949_length_734_cov_1.784252_1_plen_161_part_10
MLSSMIKSCRARREVAPPSSTAFPYHFVQALGNITRQHFRQLRSVTAWLSCVYSILQWHCLPRSLRFSLIFANFSEFFCTITESKREFVAKMGENTVTQKYGNWLRMISTVQTIHFTFYRFLVNYAMDERRLSSRQIRTLFPHIWTGSALHKCVFLHYTKC